MAKKLTSLLFSLLLVFSLAGSAFADAEITIQDRSTVSEKTVSVSVVVPPDYLDAVKGKFQSQKEVQIATGFKSVKSNIASDNGAIIVNNLDELAALLSYYAGLENSANNSHPPISPFASSSYTTVVEQTIWGDGLAAGANLSWITGVVKLKKDSDTNKILEIMETSSSLEGFHPGNSWVHNSAKTSYGIDSNKSKVGQQSQELERFM